MRKLVLLLLGVFVMFGELLAQNRTITGKVLDEQGNPVSNASVLIKGTESGTSTDGEGGFSLSVGPSARILVISAINFKEQEVSITSAASYSVVLEASAKSLDEVVVVAYGQQQRKALIGAVSSVDADKISRQQIVSATQALQGHASGVLVINSTGQPGDNPTIRIRGIGSRSATADPLIVVDGIPFDGNINNINPNDIQSMNVLKDATATALYGSRAANGVILITTKTGRKGKYPEINVYSSFGVSSRAVPEYDFVTSEEYMKLAWEARKFQYLDAGATDEVARQNATNTIITNMLRYNPYNVANPIDVNGNLVPGAQLLWNTDWTEEIQNSSIQRKNVGIGISGGADKFRYYLSGDYLDQDGYVINSNFKRITARFNGDADLRDWLTLGIKMNVASSNQNYPDQSGSAFRNAVQFSRMMSSIYPLYMRDNDGALILDDKGEPTYDYGTAIAGRTVNVNRPVANNTNAIGIQMLDKNLNDRLQTSINTYGEIRFTDFLTFRSAFGIDRGLLNNTTYYNPDLGDAASVSGRVRKDRNLTTSWTWNNMFSFQKRFNEHNIGAMVSTEAYDYKFEYLRAGKTGLPVPGLTELTPGSVLEDIDSYTNQNRLNSYLGRVTYDYSDKYFFEGSIRRDGSTRWRKDKRWGTFFAVGGSWVISQESFFGAVDFVDFLKLRASYGEVGNQAIPDEFFPYLTLYDGGYADMGLPGIYLGGLANPDITWEKLGTYNIGIDFAVLNNRLSGSLEYYNKKTFDLLFNRPFPGSTGITGVQENVGELTNKGFELVLNSTNVLKKNFSWETSFNIATLKNEITKLPQQTLVDGAFRLEVGQPMFSYWIYEWAGVNPDNGNPQWYRDRTDGSGEKDIVNGIATATRNYHGTALPKYTGGLNNSFRYTNFDLSFLFNYAFGGKVLDADYISLMHGFSSLGNQLHKDILDRWQQPGDITDVPRLRVAQNDYGSPSTRHLFKGDYIRLRNVTLGYTLPEVAAAAFGNVVKTLRFYIQADNYLTWSAAKKGLDPELNIQGQSAQRSSSFKTISFGLNLGL